MIILEPLKKYLMRLYDGKIHIKLITEKRETLLLKVVWDYSKIQSTCLCSYMYEHPNYTLSSLIEIIGETLVTCSNLLYLAILFEQEGHVWTTSCKVNTNIIWKTIMNSIWNSKNAAAAVRKHTRRRTPGVWDILV